MPLSNSRDNLKQFSFRTYTFKQHKSVFYSNKHYNIRTIDVIWDNKSNASLYHRKLFVDDKIKRISQIMFYS